MAPGTKPEAENLLIPVTFEKIEIKINNQDNQVNRFDKCGYSF